MTIFPVRGLLCIDDKNYFVTVYDRPLLLETKTIITYCDANRFNYPPKICMEFHLIEDAPKIQDWFIKSRTSYIATHKWITFKFLDPLGIVVEYWILNECSILNLVDNLLTLNIDNIQNVKPLPQKDIKLIEWCITQDLSSIYLPIH